MTLAELLAKSGARAECHIADRATVSLGKDSEIEIALREAGRTIKEALCPHEARELAKALNTFADAADDMAARKIASRSAAE